MTARKPRRKARCRLSSSPNEILGGPPLVDSDYWAIVAKTSAPRPTLEQQMAMLRQLLAERFQVRVHRGPKEMGILRVDGSQRGPKLKPSPLDPGRQPRGSARLIFVVSLPVLKLAARYANMDDFAILLQRALEQPVADQTGLLIGRHRHTTTGAFMEASRISSTVSTTSVGETRLASKMLTKTAQSS